MRTLCIAAFAVTLLFAAACKKKVAAPAPPPPPPAAAPPAPPPPPPPAAARINSFTVEPSSIQRGQAATLAWAVANATDISIDNGVGGVQANGMRQVFPGNSTTYTLTARGSGGTDTRSVTVEVTSPPPPPPPAAKPTREPSSVTLNREASDALFGYDKSDIRDDARTALTKDAEILKRLFAADPGFTVMLEGNCDERGSAEYNLGLGDRRSTSAKDFLVQQGVPADKLRTISYGKDRPVCTEASEDCYQRNRRVHLAPAQ
jgi:peptidoglycan-associated lipoprotein